MSHISVIIPARDEEELLPRCLRSIQDARARLGPAFTSDVIVVSDDSGDSTARIAAEVLGSSGAVRCIEARAVGVARNVGAVLACARFDGDPARHWLASTDADCEVPPCWLQRHLTLAAQGWTAVAGIISVEDFTGHGPEVRERFRSSYSIHADGTHPHIHGANLGVRRDAYLQAGGWSGLETAEDHDLWGRLGQTGSRRLSDASLRVVTSSRRIGRAPAGFADALATHNLKVA